MTTPGPWRLKEHDGEIYIIGTPSEWGNPTVCDMPTMPSGGPCKDAMDDGRLIATAPEMFDLLVSIENDGKQVPPWLWEKIQAVVVKAGGKAKGEPYKLTAKDFEPS